MPEKGTVIVLPQDENQPQQPLTPHLPFHVGSPKAAGSLGSALLAGAQESRKDVDILVQEIKENLKLGHAYLGHRAGTGGNDSGTGSGGGPLKARSHLYYHHHHHSHRGSSRATPYHVPPTSRISACDNGGSMGGNHHLHGGSGGPGGESQLRRWNHRRRYPSTCKSGTKGSATDPDDPFQLLQELITDGSLIKEAVRRLQLGLNPKFEARRSFYDSDDDDDCRTPPAAYSELCCEVGAGGRM